MTTYCGAMKRIGHGENDVCGLVSMIGKYQCAHCQKTDADIKAATAPTIPHTPTRLTVRANGDANSYALLDDNGHWFMSLLVNGEQLEAKQEANLRRLAACWNACTSLTTDEIEARSVS